jgi:hypothetical protein
VAGNSYTRRIEDSSSLKVREEGEEKDEHLMHKFKK